MIKALVVDDQTLVRQGICNLLELSEKIQVIGQAEDGPSGLDAILTLKPDVVLLDIRMPGMTGIDLLLRLRELADHTPVVLLTTFDDPSLVLKGVEAGAKGFLLKDIALEDLVKALEEVVNGGTMVKPMITERVLKGLSNVTKADQGLHDPEPLTARETEILRLMAGGYSNREIAKAVSLSEGTVKNHVSNILSKFSVRDRTRAVLRAAELGWL